MAMIELPDWLESVTGQRFIWFVKRLSGNDTLANGSHQVGLYMPKEFMFRIFPELNQPAIKNPDVWFDLHIVSHLDSRKVRAIWYNNRLHGGTRNETRITNLGGINSALQDPDSTGALTVLAFELNDHGKAYEAHVWVCDHPIEEDLVEDQIGPVDPGQWKSWTINEATVHGVAEQGICHLEQEDIPANWLENFPTGIEIIKKVLELSPNGTLDPDHRLIKRRNCEFMIYRSLENAVEFPRIEQGFSSIDEFVAYAQTILQRRKSRSGRSLELHIKTILIEEELIEGEHFSHQSVSESGHKPDFVFPNGTYYKNAEYPDSKLRMLAVKTTCKDRWRQILNEATRIKPKHLLTLQEGVSAKQFKEMITEGVQLVVPQPLISTYPKEVQPHLQTFESFIADVRLLSL
jgi:hypothetical protein